MSSALAGRFFATSVTWEAPRIDMIASKLVVNPKFIRRMLKCFSLLPTCLIESNAEFQFEIRDNMDAFFFLS